MYNVKKKNHFNNLKNIRKTVRIDNQSKLHKQIEN